jgi:hypothetical protein
MRAENKAMGLEEEEEEDDDDDDDDESAEYYGAVDTTELDVHSSPSPPVLGEESLEPTEALPSQAVQPEDKQPIPESDRTSKKRKGKGKAELTRLSKAEQKALEREAALQSDLRKDGASDGDVPKSTKKSKRKPKNGTLDAMAAATGASTPAAESEPPVEGDTFEMQNPERDAVPEMSKKDKRRAKEAAKKAQQEPGSSSVNLVSHTVIADFSYEPGVLGVFFLDTHFHYSSATSVNKPLNRRPSSLITSGMRDMLLLQSKGQRVERRGNGCNVFEPGDPAG